MNFLTFGLQNFGSKRRKPRKNLLTAMEIAYSSLRSDFTSRNLANAVFCRCLLQVVNLLKTVDCGHIKAHREPIGPG